MEINKIYNEDCLLTMQKYKDEYEFINDYEANTQIQ